MAVFVDPENLQIRDGEATWVPQGGQPKPIRTLHVASPEALARLAHVIQHLTYEQMGELVDIALADLAAEAATGKPSSKFKKGASVP